MNEARIGAGADRALDEGEVQKLLEGAGRRPRVPARELAAIKATFRADWEQSVERRRGRERWKRNLSRLALAASLLAAIGLGWWWRSVPPAPAGPGVAMVETLSGEVLVRIPGNVAGGSLRALTAGETIPAGAELETVGEEEDAGRAALRLDGGQSLRIDLGSRLRIVSATVLELDRGAVYVDSESGSGGAVAVAVRTPVGSATEIGTQFEVRLLQADQADQPAMRVRVREGAVSVEQGESSYLAENGQEMILGADGSMIRARVEPFGAEWRWILDAAPGFEIEGRTLSEFLVWTARETGWRVRFSGAEIEDSAGDIILHGTIGDLTPDEAPAVVLPGAGLDFRLDAGVLTVVHGADAR